MPDQRQLRRGDIVNIDVTIITPDGGWHGDTSRMVRTHDYSSVSADAPQLRVCLRFQWTVGGREAVSVAAATLVADTHEAMWRGIRQVRPGNHVGDIGAAIQGFAEQAGHGVVTQFFGHGIGQHFHESPMVAHFGEAGTGALLEVGMVITV